MTRSHRIDDEWLCRGKNKRKMSVTYSILKHLKQISDYGIGSMKIRGRNEVTDKGPSCEVEESREERVNRNYFSYMAGDEVLKRGIKHMLQVAYSYLRRNEKRCPRVVER